MFRWSNILQIIAIIEILLIFMLVDVNDVPNRIFILSSRNWNELIIDWNSFLFLSELIRISKYTNELGINWKERFISFFFFFYVWLDINGSTKFIQFFFLSEPNFDFLLSNLNYLIFFRMTQLLLTFGHRLIIRWTYSCLKISRDSLSLSVYSRILCLY